MDRNEYLSRINFKTDDVLFEKPLKFPYIYHENDNVFGHINQCKYSLQMGCLSCRCTNPKCPSFHCTFGWHTKGIVPDQFCEWYVLNPYFSSVSVDYHTNQKKLVKTFIEKKLINSFNINKALSVNNIKEYVHKPYNAFIIGLKDYDEEYLKVKYPFLYQYSKDVNIFCVNHESNYASEMDEMKGFEFRPSMFLPHESVDSNTFKKIEIEIRELIKHKETNIQTRINFNKQILTNEIMNLAYMKLSKTYEIQPPKNPIPILCIAGGATLDNHLQLIKEIQNNILIIAIPTVYKTLIDNDIIPDYICLLDPQHFNKKYLETIPPDIMKKSTLIFDIDSNHEVVDMFQGDKIIHVSSIGKDHLYNNLIPKEYSNYKKHGTVSLLSYQLATMLNPSEIYLIGYDLCYHKSNPKTHADGCAYQSNISFITDNKNNTYIQHNNEIRQAYEKPCYNNELAYVSVVFNNYLHDLEKTARYYKIPTYNIDEKSIKKEGIPLITIDKFKTNISNNTKTLPNIKRISALLKNKEIKKVVSDYINTDTFMLTYFYNVYLPMLFLSEDSLRCNPTINKKLMDYVKLNIKPIKTDIYNKLTKKLVKLLKGEKKK
jgi:hypothetical protein